MDEYGDPVITVEKSRVFCRVKSIGMKEFYQAQAVGLQPEITFVLPDYLEYNGQARVEYGGVDYRILRTYRASHELELVCYREVSPDAST